MMPHPLPRQPTAAETEAVNRLAEAVLLELQATRLRVGHAPPLTALEGTGTDGQPHLPSGLPDNPLAAGVAGVAPGCPGDPHPPGGIDWVYCAAPLAFRPAHEGTSQSGKP